MNLAETDLISASGSQPLVQVLFAMTIGTATSQIMQILPLSFAKEMVATLVGSLANSSEDNQESEEEKPVSSPSVSPTAAYPSQEEQTPATVKPMPEAIASRKEKVIQPVAFAPLTEEKQPTTGTNMDLLLDIPLEVTVELGRTKRLIKDVLELGVGSVVELDKLAGEPVDVVVNGKLVARGEVVVIDENFGVRITDVLTPVERVKQLQ